LGLFAVGEVKAQAQSSRTEELRRAAREYYDRIKPGMTPEQVIQIRRDTLDKAYLKSSDQLAEDMRKGMGMTPEGSSPNSGGAGATQGSGNFVTLPSSDSSQSSSAASNAVNAPGTVFVPLDSTKQGINAPFRGGNTSQKAAPPINRPLPKTPPKR
jgi:hypothetical protein